MASRTSKVLPRFDFSEAESLSVAERIERSLERARELLDASGYEEFPDSSCLPPGATEAEIEAFEKELGVKLSDEYRQFLSVCRYLKLDDGVEIGGIGHATAAPWISEKHRPGVRYLVFADYWQYADGDQLMFDLSEPDQPVVAYLHSHGPLFEDYAPSFSLALWRLVHEYEVEEDDFDDDEE
jgi:hypothetical protein